MLKKILVLAFLFVAGLSYGQSIQSSTVNSSQAVDRIEQTVQARYGAGYEIYAVAVDTLLGRALPDGYADFTDPNHLLRGALLFSACRPPDFADSSIFGIYKDGAVRWMSGPVIDGYLEEVIGITDLLGDGTDGILTTWDQTATSGDASDLWIFNWDGNTGRVTNDYDTTTHRSALFGMDTYFEATNLNNSRVSQILSSQRTGDSVVVVEYVWTGSKYIQSPTPTMITESTFLPANLMHASLSVTVNRDGNGFMYSYSVSNSNDSRQAVQAVYLEGVSDWSSQSAPPNWTFIPWGEYPIAEWEVGGYPQALVLQGQTKDGFVLSGGDSPVIVTYHLQGLRIPPVFENESEAASDELFLNDMRTNSISGKTVGNSNSLASLDYESFLDTLISYKDQCVALGWLRNDRSREQECEQTMRSKDWYMKEEGGKMERWGVNDSWDFDRDWNSGLVGILDKRLDMAKRMLTRGDSVQARRELQIFVMEVELVNRLGSKNWNPEAGGRKPVMSSEAYALLKYNAEYLIDRLPERQGRREGGPGRGKK